MDIQAISSMLKDGSDKREEDIDRLVTRLAGALTPLIADHVKRYGLPGTTHPLKFVPSDTEMFDHATHNPQRTPRHVLFLATKSNPAAEVDLYLYDTLHYHHNRQRRDSLDFTKELIVPLVVILQRLTSLYKESGFILDLTSENNRTCPETPDHEILRAQILSLDIKLQPIQASDKPS